MSASTRVAVASFWEYLAFALNSLVFLLIGFEVRLESLLHAWKPILVAYAAVTLARLAIASLVAVLLRRTRERLPFRWITVLTWGGLRGALSMVLVLGLPPEFEHRDLVVAMTFGVVVISILTQGTTMGPLLRRLKLVAASEARVEHDRVRGALGAARAALAEIDRMSSRQGLAASTITEIREDYAARVREGEAEIAALHTRAESILEEERVVVRRQALIAEKDAILDAYRSGEIGEPAYEHLLAEVDARLFELESREEVAS